MKTRILLFHPHLNDQSRVNAALGKAAADAGYEVRNMYDIYPDFKIDVAHERQLLEDTDRIIFQFPIYWYSSPALLKQYEDDVFTGNWAYNGGRALENKEWLLAVSPGANQQAYSTDGRVHYQLRDLLRPFQATNTLIKTKFAVPFVTFGASSISDDQLAQRARDYVAYLGQDKLPLADLTDLAVK